MNTFTTLKLAKKILVKKVNGAEVDKTIKVLDY